MGLGIQTWILNTYRNWAKQKNKKELADYLFEGDRYFLKKCEQEVRDSKLTEHINTLYQAWKEEVRPHGPGRSHLNRPYTTGRIEVDQGIFLYSLIRRFKPSVVVETGVCNGYSTAYMLLGLHQNKTGKLYSIDFPQIPGKDYEEDDFWEGQSGAVIPPGRTSGWLIPDHLRDKWELILGKSQEKLPPLLEQLGAVDFFMHDSEHSYDCMWFEYNAAYPYIKEGGLLLSDDVNHNSSFKDFAEAVGKKEVLQGKRTGVLIK